ncbi:MAG TPA: hypothetical protein VHB23_10905 [Devosiaceae bacterium]|jgi:hypothetical protein|nr:hypothetical protein [Devosiaceae bacterium]
MTLKMIGRLAGAVALTMALAGCIDMTMDVKVKNESEAQGVMSTTVGAQFYPMIKANMKSDAGSDASKSDDFCSKDEGGVLVENADGSATCTVTKEGKFADLVFDKGDEQIKFTSPGPGLVRVSFPTDEFQKGLDAATTGGDESASSEDADAKAATEQMKTAMIAYFAGHFLTIRIEGAEVTESNMTISDDKKSAEQKIPFTDIMSGTAKLPDELYAVVKVN